MATSWITVRITAWFINEEQQQATKNNELKAKQHSESHEPDIRKRNKRDQPN